MVTSFSDFISHLIGARFSFSYIWDFIKDLFRSVIEDPSVSGMWDGLKNFSSSFAWILPYILMILGIAVALFGQKMGGVVKFLGFFIVGFFLGVYLLVPVIPSEVRIPGWIIGLIIGILSAILSKFLFIAGCSIAALYSIYRICYHGFFLDMQAEFSLGKALVALFAGVIILVLMLVLFRFVEMFLFSALGAWFITSGFGFAIIDLGEIPKLGDKSWILEISIIGVIAILGFIFQFRTRRRY